ncbi:GNAT family N-acetyltransferase [Desulfospira joergensenii]|uniref:GNAT family N-acetyltransferase n=1 Tax=Desulfospira joergensenii TaxID=53329 RepID=UPI0003B52B63|nr:GNAT family N-acetyltransferase [Desulfospira joergensenii]
MIREKGPGDLGWIISEHGSVYAGEFGFDSGFEVDIAQKAVALCQKDEDFTKIWIKEINGRNAGSIAISEKKKGIAFINFLLVSEEFRGRGIAGELMARAMDHAGRNGYKKLRLETYSCLKTARKIYADLGFHISEPLEEMEKYGRKFDREFWELEL